MAAILYPWLNCELAAVRKVKPMCANGSTTACLRFWHSIPSMQQFMFDFGRDFLHAIRGKIQVSAMSSRRPFKSHPVPISPGALIR